MLVPATKEVHELIDDEKYEKEDFTLNLAINEKYFNDGHYENDNPVVVQAEMSDSEWEVQLTEEPEWTYEQGYPLSD